MCTPDSTGSYSFWPGGTPVTTHTALTTKIIWCTVYKEATFSTLVEIAISSKSKEQTGSQKMGRLKNMTQMKE